MNYNNVFKNQTKLDIILTTKLDLTDASTVLIKYKKPSGILGSWVATIDDIIEGVIKYTVMSSTDINETGYWVIWAHVTFNDLTYIAGKPVNMVVDNEGQI